MTTCASVRSLVAVAVLCIAGTLFAASPWTPVGPAGGAVYALTIDPKDANVLYAGTWGGGVWKSKDGGANWTRLAGAPIDETFNGVAVSPADSRIILGASPLALYRSTDAGATWKRVLDQAHSQPEMTGFAFDPGKNTTVYASSDSDGHPHGVFKSTDSGATWKAANGGIHQNSRVYNVAVARDSSAVFAASSDGVYQSDDGGATWKLTLSGKAVHSVATGPEGLVVAGTQGDGIWRTVNGGTEWTMATTDARMSGNRVFALASSTATPGLLYAGIPNRILRSTDGGATWKTITKGFNWINFRSVALDEKSGTVWGGTGRDGVVKSADGGATWTTGAGFLSLQVTSVLIDPASPKRIFVGSTQAGVHRSDDGGATWVLSNEGMTDRSVHSLAAHPTAPGTFMVGTTEGGFRSTDSGASWTHTLKGGCEPVVQHLRFAPANPKRVYAHSGRDFCQVMRSDDSGVTWKEVKTPRPDSSMRGRFAFYVDATEPDRIAFNTDRNLYLSTDGGTNWTNATGIPPTSRIQTIIAAKTPQDLFAGTHRGIYRSADAGKTWTAVGASVKDLNVTVLLFDATSETIWAGAVKDGIYRSADNGKTWSRAGGEPPHPDVSGLALEAKSLLVGFSGGGVYRLDVK